MRPTTSSSRPRRRVVAGQKERHAVYTVPLTQPTVVYGRWVFEPR